MRAKSSLIVLVCSICMLALLALFFAVAGAWYRAERDGKVEMIFDSGIKFSLSNTDADGNLNYFVDGNELNTSSSNILPLDDIQIEQNATYKVLKPTISVISGTKSFYARAKLVYNFYVYESGSFVKKTASQLSGGPTETQTLNTLISQDLTFASKWLLADDGYYYYSIDSTNAVSQNNLQIIDENSSAIEILSGNTLTIGSWENLVGGPYGIDRFEIKLELDVIESSLKSTWNPKPCVEALDTSLYTLKNSDASETISPSTSLEEGTTYTLVENATNKGYIFTYSNNDGSRDITVYSYSLYNDPTTLNIYGSFIWNGDVYTTTKIVGSTTSSTNSTLTSVVIPNTVTSIETYAFRYFSNLNNVVIPNSVTSIGASAFRGCTSLESVTIGSSVTSIGASAFQGCTSLESATIGSGVTTIGAYAFSGCTSLASITIPNSVTTIGEYAFQICTSLANITIPNSVTSLGLNPFDRCTNLDTFVVSSGNLVYSTLDNGNLLMMGTRVVAFAPYGITDYSIPNSVTEIGSDAFYGCSGLTNITIPNSVTSIGTYAFSGCTSITTFTIPKTVIEIGDYALKFTSKASDVGSVTFYFDGTVSEWTFGTTGKIFGGLSSNDQSVTLTIHATDGDISYSMYKDSSCLVEGTKVTLADGSFKNVEDITYNDLLLTKDLIDGGFSAQYAAWVEKVATTSEYTLITFDDGSTLKFVGEHGLFDIEKNCFVEYGNKAFPLTVGAKAYKLRTDEDGNLIKDENGNFVSFTSEVVSIETIYEEVNFYHIFSSRQHNIVSDGVVTSAEVSPLLNMYGFDEEMKFIKENREIALSNQENLYTFEDYNGYIPYWLYVGFRADECKYLSISGMMSEEDWFNFVTKNTVSRQNYVEPDRVLTIIDGQEIEKIVWTVSTSDEFDNLFDESYEKTKVFDGDEFTLPEPKEASGKTFLGWKSSIDGKLYQVGDKVQIWLGTHFEAVWQ